MNNRDIEHMWKVASNNPSHDTNWHDPVVIAFADLVAAAARADEREALEKIDWTALMREGSLVTWGDAQELGDRILAAIRVRGNT
jgi:hypothetical protein